MDNKKEYIQITEKEIDVAERTAEKPKNNNGQ